MKTVRVVTRMVALLALMSAAVGGCLGVKAQVPASGQGQPAFTLAQGPEPGPGAADAATQSRAHALVGELPLYFIENRGQEDPRVAYYLQGRETAVYFTGAGLTFALSGPKSNAEMAAQSTHRPPVRHASLAPEGAAKERWAVRLDFVGANAVVPRGEHPTPATVSYFKGGAHQSQPGLKTYGTLAYPELWPGIDLVYTGDAGHLKYTFLVKPGADPNQIRLAYRGATGVILNDAGQLAISTPVGGFTDDRPYAYQERSDGRDEVPAAYALTASDMDGQGFGFRVGSYDASRTLVLDPSVLIYAGYIGGSESDFARGIAADAAGNAYIVGFTESAVPSFPAKVGPDLVFGGGRDVFVAKVKADGSDLVYLGYIGGAGDDIGRGIAVDKAGNAYVTGATNSDESTFPVRVGPHLTHSSGDDAFVAKVNAAGTALVYCGYIGGAGTDEGRGIAVDAIGNAYLVGFTTSDESTFPVRVGPDLVFNGGPFDAFVAKVKADGTALVYLGYIGGAGDDIARAIAVDSAGNAYVAGRTSSDQADGTALVYAGYVGGAAADRAFGIAVDVTGSAYIAGLAASDETSFPVKVGPGLVHGGGNDAFAAKVKPDGSGLLYAGYIGGADNDFARGIAVDAAGNAYIAGDTRSDHTTFPVTVGPDLIHGGLNDTFVAKISGKAELAETGTIAIPIVVKPGGTLTVFDTVSNLGLGSAKASTSRYYFSLGIAHAGVGGDGARRRPRAVGRT